MRVKAFFLLLCVLTLPTASLAGNKTIYGLTENVGLPDFGLEVEAKLDTGAQTASLSARDITRFKRKGESWVRFYLAVDSAHAHPIERPLARISKIKRRAGDYDVSRNGWVMDYNDPSNMIELFTTTNGNNDGKYSNPEFDAAVEASKVADKSVHFQKLHEAEDILMADAACIPVAYYNDFWLQSPSLKGTWHSPYGYWYLQYGYVEE